MAIQYPSFQPTLSRQDMGVPDYVNALTKGLEFAYKPRNLENAAVGNELLNKIREAKAKYAEQQELANLQSTLAGTGLTGLNIERLRNELRHKQAFQDLLSGMAPGGTNAGRPGYMTPHGFEGSLTGMPAEDYYDNTGEDRQAEQEAIDRIDRANALKSGESFVPSIPSFEQKVKEGVQNNSNPYSAIEGKSQVDKLNYIYNNYPLYRKNLEELGYKPVKEHALTGAARDAESMKQLADRYGKDSDVYKNAEALNNYKIQQQKDLSDIRHRQLNGLKPGDTEIRDPNTGEVIGFKKQTTDKQKEAAKNTVLFNHLYPLVYKGAAILSGPGATAKLEYAARTYKTNPESKKIIDDFIIAEKAATTTAVTEASRFGAGRTNQTFNKFVETLKAEDIPSKLKKWIKEYEIPYEANLKAGARWQRELNTAERLANKQIHATMDYYFDPDKQFAHEQERMNVQSQGNQDDNDPLGIR